MLVRSAILFFLAAGATCLADKGPLPIADLKRTEPVDFDREVRPFLSDNCLSCHCQTTTKGGLNLETPELMLKGGDTGPAIVPRKATESLLLQAAAHEDNDLTMPPRDNKAKAKNLTPEQLALLKLWIDQGAKASPKKDRVIAWQPLAPTLGGIFATAVTPDGQYAACARANRIFLYHLPSGRVVMNEAAHHDQVNSLAFSPDGSVMASGSYREVKLWRRTPIVGKPAQAATAPEPDKRGQVNEKSFALLNADGKTIAQVNHGDAIAAWAVSPDGQRFVTAGGNAAKLWGANGKMIAELRGNRFAREQVDERDRELQVETSNVAYRKDAVTAAQKAAQAAQDRIKKTADAIPVKEKDVTAKEQAAATAKTASTAADQTLAAAEAELKKAETALQEATANAAKPPESTEAAAIAEAKKQAAQAVAKATKERDTRETQRKQAATKAEAAKKQLMTADEAVKTAKTAKETAVAEAEVAKTEAQKTAASVTEAKAAVDAAEAVRKNAEAAVKTAKDAATAAEKPITAVAFSPDGAVVVTAGEDQLVHTWTADKGVACEVLKGHAAPITALAFDAKGELVSTAGDGATLAWNLAPEWKLERTLGSGGAGSPITDRVNAIGFSRDGKQLATGSGEPSRGGEIKLWDAVTGKLVKDYPKIHSEAVFSLEFSPDGKMLASGAADKMARVIDLATGKLVRSFEGHTHHVLGVTWSADGRTLATAGADGVVKIWDVTTGDRKKNIEGYEKEVTAVRFVGATTNLLTSSGDNKVRMVGVDGKEVRSFPDVADFMESAAVSADGKIVVAGGEDGVFRVWSAPDGAKLAAFTAKAP